MGWVFYVLAWLNLAFASMNVHFENYALATVSLGATFISTLEYVSRKPK